ncbi:VanZ family protein [Salinibacterium sp. ZJ77]|uniref:VanZ family protein n=1 Tax=Salinibacterium sp. ZJ77 TaxID=2708337 RepID=UPI00141ED317|nr:VanZ family protein [Salinibacterium sp. ZJ77]
MRTLLLRLLFAVYLVAVGVLVWSPAPDDVEQTGILAAVARWVAQFGLPFEATWTVLEVVGNVVLFVPFGVLAMTAFREMRVWSTAAAGLATSGIIEGVQLFLPTRFSTVSDLVANTAGALVGALAVALWRRRVSAAERRPS